MDALYGLLEGVHVFLPAVAVVLCVLVVFFFGLGGATPKNVQPSSEYLKQIKQHPEKAKPKKAIGNKPNKAPNRPPPVDKKPKQPSTPTAVSIGADDVKPSRKAGKVPKRDFDEVNEDTNNGWVMVTPRRRGKQPTDTTYESQQADKGSQKKKKKKTDASSVKKEDSRAKPALAVPEPSEDELPPVKPLEKKPKKDKKLQRSVGSTRPVASQPVPVEELADDKEGPTGGKKKRRARREA